MVADRPTSDFAKVPLEIATIRPGEIFGHIYLASYPDALGFGKSPSRFSDPRRRVPQNRFGVLYLGQSLSVCFLETILRDRRNGAIGDFPISERELLSRKYAEISAKRTLRLVDLKGNAGIRMGVPSDVGRASSQNLSRLWSVAFYEHPEKPDGVIYPSRLNGEINLAIYDRAVPELVLAKMTRLMDATELASVLNNLKVALVP